VRKLRPFISRVVDCIDFFEVDELFFVEIGPILQWDIAPEMPSTIILSNVSGNTRCDRMWGSWRFLAPGCSDIQCKRERAIGPRSSKITLMRYHRRPDPSFTGSFLLPHVISRKPLAIFCSIGLAGTASTRLTFGAKANWKINYISPRTTTSYLLTSVSRCKSASARFERR